MNLDRRPNEYWVKKPKIKAGKDLFLSREFQVFKMNIEQFLRLKLERQTI